MAQFDDLEERQAVGFISQILRTSDITCFLKTVFSDGVCMILIMIAPNFVLLLSVSNHDTFLATISWNTGYSCYPPLVAI